MSLEKEIEKYLESRGWFKEGNTTGHFDYNGLSEYIKDFATQQTEKLSTELEQTKEKLKRCEEVIDSLSRYFKNSKHESYIENVLTQLKDNG